MKLMLNRDYFTGSPTPPRVFLCNTGTKRIQELQAFNRQLNGKWSSYSEFSFETQRTYVDLIDGETKIHPAYDKIEVPRRVFVEHYGYFGIQDVDDTSGDSDIKNISCFSAEYATSDKYLTNWHINTGEIDSVEVLYNESQFGLDYSTDRDSFYKLASGDFDPYESYYKRTYTDKDSYTYEQIQIANAEEYNSLFTTSDKDFATESEKLYVKSFPNVQFYNPGRPGLSLLHLAFDYIPEWKIGNVDSALWHKERKFSETRISVYDFLMNKVSETFGCSFIWDSITGLVHIYENADDDDDSENEANTRWETDVFVSKSNLASQTQVKYSADNIKTKLVVSGADDLNIREVNLGSNAIMDLSFYHTEDWMETDLFEAYNNYLRALQEAETGVDRYGIPSHTFPMAYSEAMKGWVAANNRYHELIHAVPSEENVLLVGDEFKKLFCVYTPIDTAYTNVTIERDATSSTKWVDNLYYDKSLQLAINDAEDGDTFVVQGFKLTCRENRFQVGDSLTNNSLNALIYKLNQYHVDEDIQANKNDNVLLKLKNPASDVATIRIYDAKAMATQYNSYYNYYTKGNDNKYTRINISDQNELNKRIQESGGNVYTNNYQIQSIVMIASTGVSGDVKTYTMEQWINGELTAEKMGLTNYDDSNKPLYDYTVSYIGTMGAYFVLAKDEVIATETGVLEVSENYLKSCGVNLLKEKHQIYTSIFQTQTEAMFSQEKYQCIVQNEEPIGDYPEGTRWLDTNSSPVQLHVYKKAVGSTPAGWYLLIDPSKETVSNDDQYNYENYQRYLDNYNKLKAVQNQLAIKQREADYCQDGQQITDQKIDISLYTYDYDDNKDGKIDEKDDLRHNGRLLEADLYRAVEVYFQQLTGTTQKMYTIVRQSMNQTLPLYTFTTSFDPIQYAKNTKAYSILEQYYVKNYYYYVDIKTQEDFDSYDGSTTDKTLYIIVSKDPTIYKVNTEPYNETVQYYTKSNTRFTYIPVKIENKADFDKYEANKETALYVVVSGHIFAVYLKDKIPYIAYANSQGVYNMIMEYIRDKTEMSSFFTEDQWIRLSPFIKEDEFNDSNFLLTGYESEEERISIGKELMEAATKELKTLCKPSLEFSMTMANILALPEFAPLIEQFQLGNFIRVEIRDGYVKRARLLEVNMNFDDLSSFDCTFGNLRTAKSEIDKHAELLSQAVTAGKQVAKSSGVWQKSAEKTNKIEDDINNGLQDATLQIRNASGQNIEIGENGLVGRKLIDGTTDQYEDEQVALINNKLVFTSDNWNTSKSCFGKFTVNGQDHWGILSDAVVSGYIQGSTINGGSLEIGGTGGTFRVNSDGSVQILGPQGEDKYADNRYQIRLEYTGTTVFSDFNDECIITCSVYDTAQSIEKQNITQKVIDNGGVFTWSRSMVGWTPTYVDNKPNVIKVKHTDIERNSQIDCSVDFDETKIII